MRKIVSQYAAKEEVPIEQQNIQVAAYCRVSTEQEEQNSSMELQKSCFRNLIDGNRNWTNAGIFADRVTGLRLDNRSEFHSMIQKCK